MDSVSAFFLASGYWAVCAAVSASIASDKGRSGPGFFAASLFFLGPLGVGVALLASPGVPVGSGAVRRAAVPGQQGAAQAEWSEGDGGGEFVEDVEVAAPAFRVGDRVQVVSPDHRRSGREGTVCSLLSTRYVNVKFNWFLEDVFHPADLKRI